MFFTKRVWFLYLFLFLFSAQTWACSLPAEPVAAIVPINAAGNGMTLVTEGNSFFYLVPQDTSCSFKVVWDPAAHNTGNAPTKAKYDWVTKAGIGFEPGTDAPNGYGYFPAQAMADFFEVQGNGNVKEAFSRATGMSTSDAFVPSLFGPYATLSGFAKPGQQSEVSTVGGTADEWPDEGLCPVTGISNSPVTSAIDSAFPDTGLMTDEIPIDFAGNTIPVYRYSPTIAVVISGTGLVIEDMQIDLTDLEVTDYKAFIRTGNKAADIEVESSPSIPWLADGVTGCPGPDFSINFFIPTFNGNKEDSKVRFKVWAPGAGFEITNIFWAWKEKVYTKDSETIVTKAAVIDPDTGDILEPEETLTREVWKLTNSALCSEGLQLTVIKPAAEAGSTDFIVYDTVGPVSSQLTTTPTEKEFAPTGATSMNFTLDILDTNPYFKESFNTSIAGKSLIQNLENVSILAFYTYPCYEYTAAAGLDMNSLKNGYGLADLTGQPTFKSYKHESQWVWKRAETSVTGISTVQKSGSSGKLAGSLNTVTGTITINQPRPWHECNTGPNSLGYSTPEPKFKIFAIAKDTAGIPCLLYDGIKDIDTLVNDTAEPDGGSSVEAINPTDGNVIPAGELGEKISSPGIGTANWSNVCFMKAKDEAGPEIQVVVFDTRTNRYHLFGTKTGVDATFSNFGAGAMTYNYSNYANNPYLGKEAVISAAHEFNDLGDLNGLFNTYLQGPGAVSTVTDGTKKGFVCQKNNRLVFYMRAFDNINTYDAGKKFGVSSFKYSIQDKDSSTGDIALDAANALEAKEYVFRFENVVGGAVSPAPYELKVTAEDYSGNKRELKLSIAVMGRKLEIRTLEERRRRFED